MKTTIVLSLTLSAACLYRPVVGGEISLQSAPPVVVKTVPVAGATEVNPGLGELRVTFSKPMQDGSWSWSTWGEENFPQITGKPRYLADGRTCVLPVKLEPDKFYATWLNSDKFKNFQDSEGRPAVPYLLTFVTAASTSGAQGSAEDFDAKIARLTKSGTTAEEAMLTLGEPRQYLWENQTFEKDHLPSTYLMVYPQGVRVMVSGGRVAELRSERPGPGFTYRGKVRLGASLEEVLQAVGPPAQTVVGQACEFEPGVLYKDIDGKKGYCYYAGPEQNLRCFFTGYKVSALYLPVSEAGASPVKPEADLEEREVNKLVSEFDQKVDLSTPENACALWQISSARKDAPAISRLSWIPLDPAEQAEWYRKEEQRDPDGLKIYLKALEDSRIVAVQTWRGDLANVITYLPFPPGKGRHPYSARTFGRSDGQWKNLGEDRLPELEAAKANFEHKKERLWQHFMELKTKASAAAPSATVGEASFDAQLNQDQRAVLNWTDRQFRSFFDARRFDGWSPEERATLEKKLIDTLNGPLTREYYQAINTLAALRSQAALAKLREIAFDRRDKDNRDRWMAIRALGMISDQREVPELVHLVYHGNINTRWWAQITLVRLTGENFGKDWNAWGAWWNRQNQPPPFSPQIIRWWKGQAEPDQLAESLEDSDRKFLERLKETAQTP